MRHLRDWVFTLAVLITLSGPSYSLDRATLRWMRDKPRIDSIIVSGNDQIHESKIRDRMYSRPRPKNLLNPLNLLQAIKGDRRTRLQRETLGRDTLEIKYLYLSRGFLGIQVEESFEMLLPDSTVLIRVAIEEGRQFDLETVRIEGSLTAQQRFRLERRASRLKPGRPVDPFKCHELAFDMKEELANSGYPYARIRLSFDTTATGTGADAVFHVTTDSLVHFGTVSITGTRVFPEKVARRELAFRPGDLYRRRDIINSQRRLIESGYFSTLTLVQADTVADRLRPDFVLRVRERKPMYITAKTGVGQSEVRDLTWDLSAGVGKRNLFGSRRLDLLGELQFGFGQDTRLLQHSYRVRYTEPWFLGIRMPLSFTAKWEPRLKDPVQDFRIETWSLALSTEKRFGTQINTTLGAEYEGVNIFDIPRDQIELTEEIKDKITVRRKLYAQFRRDSRDDRFIPRWGSVTEASIEYYGGFLGGEVHFYKWQASWSRYQPVWPGWIAATRIKFGQAQSFGRSEVVPVDDRFYLGGANTVRGFRENTLGPTFDDGNPRGAEYVVLFNQELRWPTLPLLRVISERLTLFQSLFLDIGNGYTHFDEIRFKNLAYSYGTGVQVVTPAGPIRIDYARRIKTKTINFDDRWHFTILYAF